MIVSQNSFSQRRSALTFLIHFGFALIGIATTLLGVILPALSDRLMLTDSESGGLFTAQFAGSLVGTLLSEQLSKRIGFLSTISIGLLATALGVLGTGSLSWQAVVFCVFLNGCGLGLSIPTVNLLIARYNGERAAAALNILNFAWGVGAVLSPSLIAILGDKNDIRLPLSALSMLLLLTAFCLLFFRQSSHFSEQSFAPSLQSNTGREIWRSRFAVLSLASFFLYVGTENCLGGWLTAFSVRLTDLPLWTLTTIFWLAFLLGRLLAPLFLRRIQKQIFILICLTVAAVGSLPLLFATSVNFIVAGVVLSGFGLAPIFPTALAQFTDYFGETGQHQARWLFVSGTLGGASLTWLVGSLSTIFGDLRIGLYVIFFNCVLLILLQVPNVRKSNILKD
jgi:fucose permease